MARGLAMKFRPLYLLSLLASLSVWFFAYRSPLWLDETVSYWEISGGFAQIWSRTVAGLSFPAYFYILFFFRELFGNRETVLRVPSVLAMLAAVFVLYRIAREFVDYDVALIVCLLFCLHPNVAFAAIDVRPYSFAILAANLAIYVLIRWLRAPTTLLSVLFGAACALIFCFHYLYAVILPAFVLCYFLVRAKSIRQDLRAIGVVLLSFAVFFAPVVPRLHYILVRRNTYSFAPPPGVGTFLRAFLPPIAPLVLLATFILAFVLKKFALPERKTLSPLLFAAILGFVPTAILYILSISTSIRVFLERYRLVGSIGIVLAWGILLTLIRSEKLRLLFSVVFVTLAIFSSWRSPLFHQHAYSWRPALAYAQSIAEPDSAPLLICSDLPQSDFEPMPAVASESILFAPLSYYKVTVPVVPLPRTLTPEAQRIASVAFLSFLRNRRRFLVLAYGPSYPTAQWLLQRTQYSYSAKLLGRFDGVVVVEFSPLP
jgi:4-amino-4-deoxy-L-arabinose transferase-like glycosyltransferase